MKIVILGARKNSVGYIYNAINNKFPVNGIILEKRISKRIILKNRIRKLGIINVINQLMFQVLIVPFLRTISKGRKDYLVKTLGLNSEIPLELVRNVHSVNSEDCISLIKLLSPDVIIVCGTRILGRRILDSTNSIIINTHVGITPKYRGVHGAYWALVNRDVRNCGSTIHLIDAGIDTGGVLIQRNIEVTAKDNFTTYGLLQFAILGEMTCEFLENLSRGKMNVIDKTHSDSRLWYHPTFTGYIYNWHKLGVK